MNRTDLEALVGTTVLADLRLDALVRLDDALATFAGTRASDGSACTVRIALALEVADHQEASLESAWTRIGRHAVGISALSQPRAAGVVTCQGMRRLAVAHAGEPAPSAEDHVESEGEGLSLGDVRAALQRIADALGQLHDQGVVHGAVHPAAIRLDPAGATLSAFGLAELASVLGGPSASRDAIPARSRSPEQVGIVPASPSPQSDTYALAMVAGELLAGHPMTPQTDPREIARRIDHPVVRPTPKTLGVELPEHVEKAFAAALQLGPTERTSDPRRFLAALGDTAPAQEPAHIPTHSGNEDAGALDPRGSGAGFETPPPSRRAPVRPSNFYPPPPPDPQATGKSGRALVFLLLGLGFLLLFGGVGGAFYLSVSSPGFLATPASATAPPATTTPAPPPVPLAPPPAPTPVDPLEEEPDAAPPILGKPPRPRTWASGDAGALHTYPDDATALIPIDADTAVIGPRDAPVTIVVFGDMQCPYTRRARVALERLLDQYDAELRVAFRHLPLSQHKGADRAAEVAVTAMALFGPATFWKVFETLTEHQTRQNDEQLLTWAEDAGADRAKMKAALDAGTYARVVAQDRNLAGRLMVRETPTFFINGRRLNGMQTQATLVDEVEHERVAARAALGSGTKPQALYASRVLFNVTSGAADRRRPRTR